MLIDGVELRPADREEVEQDPEDQAAVVEPESPPPDPFAKRMLIGCDIAQTEINEADPQ